MNFLKPKPQEQTPQFNLQQAFTNLQNHFSSLKPHLDSPLNLQNHAKQAIESGFSRPFKFPPPSAKNPAWARISAEKNGPSPTSASLSTEEIEERLAGVPVYALSNPSEEFVLVSNVDLGKSLGLFCFKEEDAETLLAQMKSMDLGMRQGSKVVAVPLNKVFQLKVDGVGFRLIPELTQIKNALNERRRAGLPDESFSGVPVFQSRSLILRSQKNEIPSCLFQEGGSRKVSKQSIP